MADAMPATLLDVFPAAPERELVLSNCASCHNAACSAIGQRPPARWDALLASHRDRVSGVDLDKVFGYLKTNFNDGKAEPKVPPALARRRLHAFLAAACADHRGGGWCA
jgi:hypothetical protein